MKSRKRARQVTTLFHKHTRLLSKALSAEDVEEAKRQEEKIERLGGRDAYQAASVLSVKYFSTSKWVLSDLRKRGVISSGGQDNGRSSPLQILEIGAINTELIEAAKRSIGPQANRSELSVQAIDIKSQHPEIQEMDFFHLDITCSYDVIVCSMVINCVPTPELRGRMLFKLKHHLKPGGLCFFTLPLTCLIHSKYVTKKSFAEIVENGVGLEILEQKSSPKIAFFVFRKPEEVPIMDSSKWNGLKIVNKKKTKKLRNPFAVILKDGL